MTTGKEYKDLAGYNPHLVVPGLLAATGGIVMFSLAALIWVCVSA